MKIVVISSSVFTIGRGGSPLQGYGGLEVIAYYCAKGLADKGHRVLLIAPLESECPGCEVVQCLPPGSPEEAAYGGCVWKNGNGEDVRWPGYWQRILDFAPDVIIDQSWQSWVAMLKLEGRLKCPILKVMHAPIKTMYQTLPPEKVLSFVCISKDQKSSFDIFHAPRKAEVCYNGVDVNWYKPIDAPRSNRFLFLARFSSIKGAAIALDICNKLDVGLDLIGDTQITGEPDYFNYCQSLADGKKRKIVGGVPRGESIYWYSQCHFFLHPNRDFMEPFGLAPVESQLCGAGVVAWDYGAMRETVKHGETGWLVNSESEFTEAVKRAAGGISDKMRSWCREWASQFSVERMVDTYEQLCVKAVDIGGW